jgi:hypothetical protein
MMDPVEVFGQENWEWMLRHIDDTRVPLIITIYTMGIFLSLVFLGMRLWSRRLAHGKLKLDVSDWLCFGSVVRLQSSPKQRVHCFRRCLQFFTLMTATDILVGTRSGAGRHIPALHLSFTHIPMVLLGNVSFHRLVGARVHHCEIRTMYAYREALGSHYHRRCLPSFCRHGSRHCIGSHLHGFRHCLHAAAACPKSQDY